ncbi:phosphatidate cytidylyltransferase [Paraliomyxa miuraensis]|uniref:phosphatidate cytidylyltransferase n=1 Tax=Paraliomyxa miuraensis TaxID=376150 RepID=UPI00224D8E27|nr:phosphatidate cytidylyltransferase [Paraliomyxa miuraensis]MCX4246680.1 phosphatidate cytidylyltransferase [Paraliomyxa miuraensis]
MGDVLKRVGTAAVLVPIVLGVIYFDPTPWAATIACVIVGCIGLDEYLRMALPVGDQDRGVLLRVVTGLLGAAIVALPAVWSPGLVLPPLLAAAAIVVGFATLGRPSQLPEAGRHFGVCLSGLLYVPMLMSVLPLLKKAGLPHWITLSLAIAFFSDTVAYFFGRAFGKHKLYAAVSPKKTWQGAFGGVLGSLLATVVVGSMWLQPTLPLVHAVVLGVLANVCAQAGDLVESMIKRTYGVKDSSNLLPGHGGMLDRIDAMVFVAPVVYYYVTLVL